MECPSAAPELFVPGLPEMTAMSTGQFARLPGHPGSAHADAPAHHRRRPRRRRLSGQGVPRGRPRRRPGAPTARTGSRLALDGGYDVLVVDRMLPKRDGLSVIGALRQEHRDAGADPLGARPGRRPRQGPARRRRRLPAQALCVLRAARARRGAGAPPRRRAARRPPTGRRPRARPALAQRQARRRPRSTCSRANSACSNT